MTEAPAPMAGTGIVGDRHLVAVQTFDIARLTTHAVPLVPGTFVAVSGQGPKGDSNGSGKTSFLAAVSLLLGEAQWRLEANGSQYTTNLLFKPESAGLDPTHRYAQADRGYVVGVFADPADPARTALTVWVRIAATTPYLKVRWAPGLHVAIADSDLERDVLADGLWEALPRAQELGPKRFATDLYGDAPRCMAYLDTPMRPSSPSLLSQQMTEMTPARIGEALIELTGRQRLLETEAEQRRRLAEQKSSLAERQEADAQARVDEQADLDAVQDRERSRQHLAEGEHMWRLHFARGFLEVSTKDAELAEMIGELQQNVDELIAQRNTAQDDLDTLRGRTNLAKQLQDAKTALDQAQDRFGVCRDERGANALKLRALADRRVELLPRRDAWTGITVDAAVEAVGAADEELAQARVDRREAEQQVGEAAAELDAARAGDGGPAGAALARLRSRNIPAALLLDEITLASEARASWEPRLWPHRHAVVVGPDDETAALGLIGTFPGISVVVADAPLTALPLRLPEGVTADVPVARFLNTLEARTDFATAPERAVDPALGEAVIGRFDEEIAGRAARVAAAERNVRRTTDQLAEARIAERTAGLALEAAREALGAAEAAAELDSLTEEEGELQAAIAELDTTLETLHAAVEEAQTAWLAAATAVQSHQLQVDAGAAAVAQLDRALGGVRDKLGQRQTERDNLNVSYWLAGWADTPEAATELLDAQPDRVRALRPRSLRSRAAEKLKEALDAYLDASPRVPAELAEAKERRQRFADGESGVAARDSDFTSIAQPLRDLLDSRKDSDRILEDRIVRSQRERATQIEEMAAETTALDEEMERLQDAISSRLEASLDKISKALDRLNRARGGFGAELRVAQTRPPTATSPWTWEVSPRWRRSPSGGMISYREVANGAQVKVFAIQLVLAALLAADGARGRVLVLDELGNSLGDVNRKDVLRDLNEVAAQQQVTILGTCQDSVIGDAAGVCGEILWFCHQAHTEAYNQPTRVWGYDANGERVALVHDWLTAGRSLV